MSSFRFADSQIARWLDCPIAGWLDPQRMMGNVEFSESQSETNEDARRLLAEVEHDLPGAALVAADCRPPLDVFETATALEVLVDVPGVPASSLRVAVRRNTLLVVGAKLTGPIDPNARFHLAERSYGRFARTVVLRGAFDAGRAHAIVQAGQLKITVPLREERRGKVVTIPVETE